MLNLTSSSAGHSKNSKSTGASDVEALDAYSRSVISVVKTVGPSVVAVEAGRSGQGTGFILTSDGLAITNAHVSDGNSKLWITLDEEDRLEAELVGEDPATDLALFQIAAKEPPACTLGDSSRAAFCRFGKSLRTAFNGECRNCNCAWSINTGPRRQAYRERCIAHSADKSRQLRRTVSR